MTISKATIQELNKTKINIRRAVKSVVKTFINCLNVSVIVDESLTTRLINSPLVFYSKARAGSNPTL